MSEVNQPLAVLRATARVFEDGVVGIKTATDLAPGEYEAVVVLRSVSEPQPRVGDGPVEPMDRFIERMRREHLRAALEQTGGNRTQAAKLLGVDPRTVFRLLDKEDT